ncbi:MAG: hypothetical protein ACLGHR_13585, partial [Gammaproteobacteria bacterium]
MVQGNNLRALQALLPRYVGRVKRIYIDLPYNIGNEGRVYNVNSPQICKRLGEVVGTEAEILGRHVGLWWCPAAWCSFRRSSVATGLGKRRRNPSWVSPRLPLGKTRSALLRCAKIARHSRAPTANSRGRAFLRCGKLAVLAFARSGGHR